MPPPPFHLPRPDFARLLCRQFEYGRLLIIGAEELTSQFAEIGREAVVIESLVDLKRKLHQDRNGPHFQIAVWFYSGENRNDDRVAEELSRCADEIVLTPGACVDVVKRRPEVVELFRHLGFLPDYICDLTEIDLGAVHLRRQRREPACKFVLSVEAAFAETQQAAGRFAASLARAHDGVGSSLSAHCYP